MSDFRAEFRRIDGLAGLGLGRLLDASRFAELIERLDDIPENVMSRAAVADLRRRIERVQKSAFDSLSRSIRNHIDLEEIDEARALLGQARAVGGAELTILASLINSASMQQQTAREVRQKLAQARELSRDGAFLSDLRDARATYQGLLDRSEVIGRHLDTTDIAMALSRVERRIKTEQAQQSVIGTKSTLDELRPNLDALEDLEARQARGEVEVELKGGEMTPIAIAIQELEAKVRPRLERHVGQHYEDARRQFDERGDPRAALKTLTRQRAGWRYLTDEHMAQLEDFEHELKTVVDEDDRKARIADDAHALLLERKPGEAARLLQLEVARLEHVPQELLNMLEQARADWLGPLGGQISRLTRRVKGLGSLQADRIEGFTSIAEKLIADLTGYTGGSDQATSLIQQLEGMLEVLDRLEEVVVLKADGRLHDAHRQLEMLGAERSDLRPLTERLMGDVGSQQSTEQLLAEARNLYQTDITAAVEFAREHVGRDGRFAAFIDFAVLDKARRSADLAESEGRYDDALRALTAARGALVQRDEPTLLDDIERRRRVVRDAPAVRDLIEFIKRDGPSETHLARLAKLEIGRDHQPRVHAWLSALLPTHVETLERGIEEWKSGRPSDLDALAASADFVRRLSALVGGQADESATALLLEEHRVCVALEAASRALGRGAVDQAESIAQPLLGSHFGDRVARFMRRCKIRRLLGRVVEALQDADFEAARATLADAPGEPEVRWATQLVERLVPLVSAIQEPGEQDPVQAFEETRRLVEEQERLDLGRLLERLEPLRLAATQARLASLDQETGLGVMWARLAALDADYRAAGRTAPALEALTSRITPLADAELEAICAWVDGPDDDVLELDAMERVERALRTAERLHPDGARIAQVRTRFEHRMRATHAFNADRVEVQRLMDLSSQEGVMKHLIDAQRIEARYAGAPFGVEARLAGWSQCDALVQRIEGDLRERRLHDARKQLEQLATLSRSLNLPHADTISCHLPQLGLLGPGVDAFQLQLDSLLEREEAGRRELRSRLAAVDTDIMRHEALRARVLELAHKDDGEQRARELARTIGDAARRHLDTMQNVRDDAEVLGLAEEARALTERIVQLTEEALVSRIVSEREQIQNTLEWLNELRALSAVDLRLAGNDVHEAGQRFKESKRISRFVKAIEKRMARDE